MLQFAILKFVNNTKFDTQCFILLDIQFNYLFTQFFEIDISISTHTKNQPPRKFLLPRKGMQFFQSPMQKTFVHDLSSSVQSESVFLVVCLQPIIFSWVSVLTKPYIDLYITVFCLLKHNNLNPRRKLQAILEFLYHNEILVYCIADYTRR